MTDEIPYGEDRPPKIERTGRMVLDPLAEVVIGVLVTVRIGSSQFVMHVLRDSKRSKSQQQQDEPD